VKYDGFVGSDSAASLRALPVVSTAATAGSNAGSYDLVPGGAESDLYQFSYLTGRLIVSPAPVILTLESLAQNYSGNALSPIVLTSVPGVPVVLTFDGSATAPVNVGTYAVSAAATGGNFSGSVSGQFVISRGSQFINLRLAPSTAALNDSAAGPVKVAATSSVGLPASLSVDSGGAASLDGESRLIVPSGASGIVTVRARQAGDSNVAPSPDAVLRLDVGKKNQEITVRSWGAPPPACLWNSR